MLARTLSTTLPWDEKPAKVANFDQIEFYQVEADAFVKVSLYPL